MSEIDNDTFGGMTVRDRFAETAMIGILASFREFREVEEAPREKRPFMRAKMAYRHADAMLAARQEPSP